MGGCGDCPFLLTSQNLADLDERNNVVKGGSVS